MMMIRTIPIKRDFIAPLFDDIFMHDYDDGIDCNCSKLDYFARKWSTSKPKPYELTLDISRNFKPSDINVQVKDGKLLVSGTHFEKNQQGHDKFEFFREFKLPKCIKQDSLKHWINKCGELVIRFDPIDSTQRTSIEDISTSDKFKVKFDVEGYSAEEISVYMTDSEIIVEGRKIDNNKNLQKSFKRIFTLPGYVDKDTLKPIIKSDGYLIVEGEHLNLTHSSGNTRKLKIVCE